MTPQAADIEPTDEMVRAFTRHFFTCFRDEDVREALAAVLTIVERDYRLVRRGPQLTNGPIHLIADGQATTTCCGRPPFELPHGQRITVEPDRATCGGTS